MSIETSVLLAGATGMLGSKIAEAMLARPQVHLRVLARKSTLAANKAQLDALARKGAVIIEGDLSDPASLVAATRRIEVVICAVQGARETIVDGQIALLEAAKRNGVRRFLPSDFAIDLFKLDPGDHPVLDWRREADAAIATSGLEHVHVLNGAFHEVLGAPFFQMFDFDASTVTYWGDGNVRFDITTAADTARYTVEAALDRTLPSGKLSIAGDQITIKEGIHIAEKAFGRRFEARPQGSVADLERSIAATKATNPDIWAPIFAQFQWAMMSGKAKLTQLANDRYPQIRPTTFATFLAEKAAQAA